MKIIRFSVAIMLLGAVASKEASAISFTGSSFFGGEAILGTVNDRSYDPADFNAFAPFGGLVNTADALVLDAFSGSSLGSEVSITLLAEAAGYADRNEFGIVNGEGVFETLLTGADTIGDTGSTTVGPEDSYKFALNSPEGQFTTSSTDNPDAANHITALEVTTAGTVTIENATLSGASFTFDLLVGDLLLFIEDKELLSSDPSVGLPSDFDYNDMVVVVRETDIPEPASALLFGLGAAGLGLRRRARA